MSVHDIRYHSIKQQKALPVNFYIYYTQFHNSFYSVFLGPDKCSDKQESISERFQCKTLFIL